MKTQRNNKKLKELEKLNQVITLLLLLFLKVCYICMHAFITLIYTCYKDIVLLNINTKANRGRDREMV